MAATTEYETETVALINVIKILTSTILELKDEISELNSKMNDMNSKIEKLSHTTTTTTHSTYYDASSAIHSTNSNMEATVAAAASSTSTSSIVLKDDLSQQPRRISPKINLHGKYVAALNTTVATPTFTYNDFLNDVQLTLKHADIMIENTYSDGMAKVIYDVIKHQVATNESENAPIVSLMISSSTGKSISRAMYQYSGKDIGWKPLLSKDIEDCLNIFTRNMMFISNEWRRKQLEEDSSPNTFERTMNLMAHMNHIGHSRGTSLEGERKKIVAKVMELIEINL